MKWLLMVFTLLARKFTGPDLGGSLKEMFRNALQQAIYDTRRIAALSFIAIGSMMFLCAGALIALLDATRQWDTSGQIIWGATLTSGVVIVAVSAAILVTIFTVSWPGVSARRDEKRALKRAARRQATHTAKSHNPVENALAVLIMDIVKEREAKRQYKATQSPNPHKPTSDPIQQDYDMTTPPQSGPYSDKNPLH